ncbi:MAG: release factor glutamine methyltransferase [Blastocatellia bacterium]|jgi:release factor glutamine methyltransferase|nr:release factor glutamine methyltransferase [Blastocatellia bacterium]
MGLSIEQALLNATHSLRESEVSEARQDAALLLMHILKCDRTFLITHAKDFLSQKALKTFFDFVKRRAAGEPLQYITGHQAFFMLDFEVTKDVLIPRPETELLVEVALNLLSPSEPASLICDVGTGSGCIAISLLHERKEAKAIGIDVSPAALLIASNNAQRHAVFDRFQLLACDCFAALKPGLAFSMIVSNPPYVTETALLELQREVLDYEPHLALAAGPDGLSIIRRLLREASDYLVDGGYFLFEIGFDQHDAVRTLVDNRVWEVLDFHKDLQGIHRIVSLQKR